LDCSLLQGNVAQQSDCVGVLLKSWLLRAFARKSHERRKIECVVVDAPKSHRYYAASREGAWY
jgi:hypothetical protein